MSDLVSPDATDALQELSIEIAWTELGVVRLQAMRVPAGCHVADALAAAMGQGLAPGSLLATTGVAVFGRLRGPDHVLVDGDRIELLGPLLVDPKLARERRVAQQRAAEPRSRWRPQGR